MCTRRHVLNFLHHAFVEFNRERKLGTVQRIEETFDFFAFRTVERRFVQIFKTRIIKLRAHIDRGVLAHGQDLGVNLVQRRDQLMRHIPTVQRILRPRLNRIDGVVVFFH